MIKDILSTATQDVADDIIAQIPGELTFLWLSSCYQLEYRFQSEKALASK
jgi:hypothetical protein